MEFILMFLKMSFFPQTSMHSTLIVAGTAWNHFLNDGFTKAYLDLKADVGIEKIL